MTIDHGHLCLNYFRLASPLSNLAPKDKKIQSHILDHKYAFNNRGSLFMVITFPREWWFSKLECLLTSAERY